MDGKSTKPEKKRIAGLATTYFTYSHADIIIGKFIDGMPTDDGITRPESKIVSLYVEQTHDKCLGKQTALRKEIPFNHSIRSAMFAGEKELSVDGVLCVVEMGDYPLDELGLLVYPKKTMFEQITAVMASEGKILPLFFDKHFAQSWEDAEFIANRIEKLNIPIMSGSSLPYCWRSPELEHPLDANIKEAFVYSPGQMQSYGIHAYETLLCMIERRKGGESGVKKVQTWSGDEFLTYAKNGNLPDELATAAIRNVDPNFNKNYEDIKTPLYCRLEHFDGFISHVLMGQVGTGQWAYACEVDNEIKSCEVHFQMQAPFAAFSYLDMNIDALFQTGKTNIPWKRTLLATGLLIASAQSMEINGQEIHTPHLKIPYRSYEGEIIRPKNPKPTGACLSPWPHIF